jgi:hypothetical protein
VRRPAEPEPDVETAVRQHVDRGELLGQHRRGDVWGIDHGRPQPYVAGHRGGEAEGDDGVEHRSVLRAVVVVDGDDDALEGPERPVPQLLGTAGDGGDVAGGGPAAGDGEAEAEGEWGGHGGSIAEERGRVWVNR